MDIEPKPKNQSPYKTSILSITNVVTNMQIGELQKNITNLSASNKKKYDKILISKPSIVYKLYKPNDFQAISKSIGKQILLRQMDRLLEERNYLDRELSLIKFEDQEKNIQKQQMIAAESDHFEILKKIWGRTQNNQYSNAVEHLEELSSIVGHLKGNILNLVKFQANYSKEAEDTYLKTFQVLHQKNRECKKCIVNERKIIQLEQKCKLIQTKLGLLEAQNIEYLQTLTNKDQQIKKLNKSLLQLEAQFKTKIIHLEEKLLIEDNSIKNIKKFKLDMEKCMFINEQENFRVFLKCDQDLSLMNRSINVKLNDIIQLLQKEDKLKLNFEKVIENQILSKEQMSQKIRTERYRSLMGENLREKMQDIENSSKRYIRTNYMATKRSSNKQIKNTQREQSSKI